jgi:hypothetical protein
MLSYIAMRGHWCNTIVQKVHSPSEDKSHDLKISFYEELEQLIAIF